MVRLKNLCQWVVRAGDEPGAKGDPSKAVPSPPGCGPAASEHNRVHWQPQMRWGDELGQAMSSSRWGQRQGWRQRHNVGPRGSSRRCAGDRHTLLLYLRPGLCSLVEWRSWPVGRGAVGRGPRWDCSGQSRTDTELNAHSFEVNGLPPNEEGGYCWYLTAVNSLGTG